MAFIIFVMAASFSFRNAASAVLGRRERSWAEARGAEPMANPAAVTTAAATSEVTNSFLLFKISAFESSHLNLIASPSKMALTLTMDLKLCAMSIATYLGGLLSEGAFRQKKSEPCQNNYFCLHLRDSCLNRLSSCLTRIRIEIGSRPPSAVEAVDRRRAAVRHRTCTCTGAPSSVPLA